MSWEKIGQLLGVEGAVTVRGDEVKFWPNGDKRYLSAADCRTLSLEFTRLAIELSRAENERR